MSDTNGLSLLAMFDDIMRNRAVLTVGIESEFATFVATQEDCRKKWMQAEDAVQEMMMRLKKLEDERSALDTKLKHARNQIDVEIIKRKRVEEERDECKRQISLVSELLRDKNNSTVLNDHARETLAFLSMDYRSMTQDKSPVIVRHKMDVEDSVTGSPEISFDRTLDDLDKKKTMKRPSALSCEDEESLGPLHKRRNEKSVKKHRRSKSVDLESSVIGNPAMTVFDDASTKFRNRRKSNPFGTLIRSSSQGLQGEALMGVDGWSPEMKRMNSGNSLTRPHLFQTIPNLTNDTCHVCNKGFKFFISGAKCKDCKIQCHSQCKDLAPLPCMATVNTPKTVKSNPRCLADYAPADRPFVPAIIIHCIKEVELRGLKQEGIYRVPGSDKDVKDLREKFFRGKTAPNLSAISDINVVCSSLKDFLKNLREPLVTFNLWNSFNEAVEKVDAQEGLADLYQVISRLPPANQDTLAYLILHLMRVSENVECKMTIPNLVTCFAPTVIGFSSTDPTPNQLMQQSAKQGRILMKLMNLPIDYWSSLLKSNEGPLSYNPSTPSNAGQYKVLSKYEEPISTSRNSLKSLNGQNTPHLCKGSLFQNPIGTGYNDYIKKTKFFARPILK